MDVLYSDAGHRQGPMSGTAFSEAFAARLREASVLSGHTGCVNRLSWSSDGRFLASGSDDRTVQVWPYPQTSLAQPLRLETHHQGNIFGVTWLPETNNRELVTGAMDFTVQHHVMDSTPGTAVNGRTSGSTAAAGTARRSRGHRNVHCATTMYAAHKGRIKGVESAPGNPNCFWSASEDGSVRQYDKRMSTSDQRSYDSPNVLIQLSSESRSVEVKSIAVNSVRPDLIALAAGDSAIRIFDRRMLDLRQPSPGHNTPPLLSLTPPHLSLGVRIGTGPHATYARFGNRGDKVIANYNGDHAYSFDIMGAANDTPPAVYRSASLGPAATAALWPGATSALLPRPADVNRISSDAEVAHGAAIQARLQSRFADAVKYISRALRLAPACAAFYGMRADVTYRRGWVGDAMWAVRDCERALKLDPHCLEALVTRAQALTALEQIEGAEAAVHAIQEQCPDYEEEHVARLWVALEDRMTARQERREKQRRHRQLRGGLLQREDGEDAPRDSSEAERSPAGRSPTQGRPSSPGQVSHQSGSPVAAAGSNGGDVASSALDAMDDRSPPRTAAQQLPERTADSGADQADGSQRGSPPGARRSEHSPYVSSVVAALWQQPGGQRLLQRFVGHCNSMTDIKEAVFLGEDDSLVACGSDDGRLFVYNAVTGEIVRTVVADADVVNCVQPHPHLPVIATSGIESTVRLWAPGDPDPEPDNISKAVEANQRRMSESSSLVESISPRMLQALDPESLQSLLQLAGAVGDEIGEIAGRPGGPSVECRVS